MRLVDCPVCQHPNPTRNPRCSACGAVMTVKAPTTPVPHPLDGGWPVLQDPAPDPSANTEPTPLVVTLRSIAPPPAPPPTAPAGPAIELVGDPADAPAAPAPAAPPAGRDARTARRAAVRRAQRRGRAAADAQPTDVLVHDADDAARETLRGWLAAFGFTVHETSDLGEAWVLARTRRFAAVFVDVVFDDSDGGAGVELCKLVKGQARERGEVVPLVLVSGPLHHVERVAAELAGCDSFVVKPVTRGAVARALDRHGVTMPADARRS